MREMMIGGFPHAGVMGLVVTICRGSSLSGGDSACIGRIALPFHLLCDFVQMPTSLATFPGYSYLQSAICFPAHRLPYSYALIFP